MKVCFFRSEKGREGLLADAFARGLLEHGDEVVIRKVTAEVQIADDCDVAVMVGVKSRDLFRANGRAGIHLVMLDKGYLRHRLGGPVKGWEYWRVAVDAHHPTKHLMRIARPHDRLDKFDVEMKPWRDSGDHILIAGSSAKYHDFHQLPDPTAFASKLVKKLKHLGRPLVYRPKPSYREAVPIKGAAFSTGKVSISEALSGAHAMVTHGSNACFEAILAGVPSIILGDAVAKPISSTSLDDVETPFLASEEDRRQWLANLAYAQFTMTEFSTGEAWNIIRPQIYG